MTIPPFIVESLRWSRPYVVTAVLLSVFFLFSPSASAQFVEPELFFQDTATATTSNPSNTSFGMRFFGINPPNWRVTRVGVYIESFSAGGTKTGRVRFRNAANTIANVTATQTLTTGWNYFDYPGGTDLADYGNDMRFFLEFVSGTGNMTNWQTSFTTSAPTANYRVFENSGSPDAYPAIVVYGIDLDSYIDEGPIGTDIVIPPGEYLVVNYPTNGTTTSSTTITLDIDYDLPAGRRELDSLLGSFCSQVEQLNGLPDCEHHTLATNLAIDTPTTVTPSVTLDYEGAYIGFISFWNGVDEDVECSWFDIWCEDETQELWETQAISFSSASTTVTLVTPFYRENLIAMCAQLPLGADYICEAMIWLFVPSTDVYVNATNQVWNQMAGKIPFGFFIYAKDTLGNVIEGTATSTYDGITVDLEVLGGETVMFDVQGVKNDEFYNRLIDTIDPYAEIFIWFLFVSYIWNRFRGTSFEGPAEGNLWGV